MTAAALSFAAWGLVYPASTVLLAYADPWTINFYRSWFALLILLLIAGPVKALRALPILLRDWRVWLLGVGGLASSFVLTTWSLSLIVPSVSAVLSYVAPFLIAWGAAAFLHERTDRSIVLPIILTLVGVGIVVSEVGIGAASSRDAILGTVVATIAALTWTGYTLGLRFLARSYSDRDLTLGVFATCVAFFAPFALLLEGLRFNATPTSLTMLGTLVALGSIGGYWAYAFAVRRLGAAPASIFIGLQLLTTSAAAYLLVDEQFTVRKITGIIVVLGGITWFVARQARSAHPADATTLELPFEGKALFKRER